MLCKKKCLSNRNFLQKSSLTSFVTCNWRVPNFTKEVHSFELVTCNVFGRKSLQSGARRAVFTFTHKLLFNVRFIIVDLWLADIVRLSSFWANKTTDFVVIAVTLRGFDFDDAYIEYRHFVVLYFPKNIGKLFHLLTIDF